MNTLLIGVIIILGLNALTGWRRGFIKTVFSLFSLIAALLLSYWISPAISRSLQSNEKIMNYYTAKVDSILNLNETGQKLNEQLKVIEELPLPESMKRSLIENNKKEIYKALDVENFTEYITQSIACFIINAIVFLISFLVILIALQVLCFILNIISKLPILNGINHFAGLTVGVLQGLLLLWVACIVLTAFSGTEWGRSAMKLIQESTFLSTIYDNNLILKYITDLPKLLF